MKQLLMTVSVVLLLGGCSQKYCEQEQSYHEAREYPPLSAPAGLQLPDQDPNMQIPRAGGDANTAISPSRRCLEIPPHIRPAE